MSHHDVPAPRRFSRRSALVALAATAGAIAVGDAFGIGSADAAPQTLDDPGSALATARRMRFDPPPTTVVGSPTYTEPVIPPEGRVMFPLGLPLTKSNIYVLDNFGDCRDHEGVDILASGGGNPIFAVADGELTKWYTNTGTAGWGWTLHVAETNVTYKYFHMANNQNGLNVGNRVRRGAILGFVGSSGTGSDTNFHLHFEVRPGDVPVDPLPLLDLPAGTAISRRNPSCP
jgi:murein DD-endopeptidase MepM/ murein hydrolase activator NlpD